MAGRRGAHNPGSPFSRALLAKAPSLKSGTRSAAEAKQSIKQQRDDPHRDDDEIVQVLASQGDTGYHAARVHDTRASLHGPYYALEKLPATP